MFIGPKGSPPVLVRVTAMLGDVVPVVTLPKSTEVVEIAMSVSTAPAGAANVEEANTSAVSPRNAENNLATGFTRLSPCG
jgi:hypothetical protein